MRLARAADMTERDYLEHMLEAHGTNQRAADAMGVHRTTLQIWMSQLGIRKRGDNGAPA